LYEPGAAIAPDPGEVIVGHVAIRAMVSGFLARKPRFTLHDSEVVQTGDIALVRSRWTMADEDTAGRRLEVSVGPTLVARRNAAGRWLVVIDRPLPAP
jgi:ketosteroid isomerase-like protein